MLKLKQQMLVTSVLAAATICGGRPAAATHQFSTIGNAQIVPGPTKDQFLLWLVSDLAEEEPFAVLEYVPEHFTRFRDLHKLSTRYQIFDGGFAGGSMRFSIGLDTDEDGDFDGHVHVYLGTPPNFNDPPMAAWGDSGNLIGLPDDELRYDTSQVGGTFFDNYSNARNLVGDARVLYVDLIVDAGWAFADGVQSVIVNDVQINGNRFRASWPRE